MSFRCSRCGEPQPTYTTPTKIVTEARVRDPGTHSYAGWEIKTEEDFCESCAAEVPDKGAAMRAQFGASEEQEGTVNRLKVPLQEI